MEIIEGNYGKCYICDNMDKNVGLPSLNNKTHGLCISDPPYNVNYSEADCRIKQKTDGTMIRFQQFKDTKHELYNDNITNYEEFSRKWFTEIMRICNQLIFTCGNKMSCVANWFKIQTPDAMIIHYKKNCTSINSLFRHNLYEPILVYGKFRNKFDFNRDVIDLPVTWGFLRDKSLVLKHPHPKEEKLYKIFIERLKPLSVLDPFLGSGTTAQVCEEIGVNWIGYEINPEYINDIKTRIKIGIKSHANQYQAESLGEY